MSGTQQGIKLNEWIPQIDFELSDGEYMQLITYDQAANQFEINEDALLTILNLSANIGFILSCGEHNCGKSTLMNAVMALEDAVNFSIYEFLTNPSLVHHQSESVFGQSRYSSQKQMRICTFLVRHFHHETELCAVSI